MSELDTDSRMGRRRRVCLETLNVDRHGNPRQRERRERERGGRLAVGRSGEKTNEAQSLALTCSLALREKRRGGRRRRMQKK